jgi:hypothetical protein
VWLCKQEELLLFLCKKNGCLFLCFHKALLGLEKKLFFYSVLEKAYGLFFEFVLRGILSYKKKLSFFLWCLQIKKEEKEVLFYEGMV